jgi:hypothetical protein
VSDQHKERQNEVYSQSEKSVDKEKPAPDCVGEDKQYRVEVTKFMESLLVPESEESKEGKRIAKEFFRKAKQK